MTTDRDGQQPTDADSARDHRSEVDAAVARSRSIGTDGTVRADGVSQGAFDEGRDAGVEPSGERFGAAAADADGGHGGTSPTPLSPAAAASAAGASTTAHEPAPAADDHETRELPRLDDRDAPADSVPTGREAAPVALVPGDVTAEGAAHEGDASADDAAIDEASRPDVVGPAVGPRSEPTVAPVSATYGPAEAEDDPDVEAEPAAGAHADGDADGDGVSDGDERDGDRSGAGTAVAAGAAGAAAGAATGTRRTIEIDRTRDNEQFAPLGVRDTEASEPLTAPRKRSNRGVAFWCALLGTIVFAALDGAGFAFFRTLSGQGGDFVGNLLQFLPTAAFWLPVVVFGLFFIVWALISNRAGFWSYVVGGLIAVALVFAGYHAGVATQLSFNTGGMTLVDPLGTLIDPAHLPASLLAALAAREAFTWFGAIIASRGRRLKAHHLRARRDYEGRKAAAAKADA